ncbi:hypothetical protein B0T18DRAFT_395099 [Schizothecium vesticola]|uniref:Uncharacterized protein n=1 Tax=Schizothecium vesticola TaxID=314040 RepID=A0AA40BR59_9PEZI|nr:hypothetical protein B0T18DRAFT_395099 [Schizothecium vesticola]
MPHGIDSRGSCGGLSASAQQVQGLSTQLASLCGDFDSAAAANAVWYQTVVSTLETMRPEDRRVVNTAVAHMSRMSYTTKMVCSYHMRSRWLQRFQYHHHLLGDLSLWDTRGTRGSPQGPCNLKNCLARRQVYLRTSYAFPAWFLDDAEAVEKFMLNRVAYVTDTDSQSGRTALHLSLESGREDDNGKSPQDVVTWFVAGKFRESETLGIVRDLEDVFSIGTAQSIGICPVGIAVALMSQELDGAAVSDDVNR